MNIELNRVLNNDNTVLITGKTGTGKTYTAKKIHKLSKYKNEKLVSLNIASLSDSLFESELFGHVRGSFSGATSDKKGFCEVASNGILFLDEIGELKKETQAKLLTLIDDKVFYSVGCTQPKRFRGKIIVATNKNLPEMVNSGEFREDLYYRLRFYELRMTELIKYPNYKQVIWTEVQNYLINQNKLHIKITNDFYEALYNYLWPGNFRELKNTIEYVFSSEEHSICRKNLPYWIVENKPYGAAKGHLYHYSMESFEKNYLEQSLKKYAGKINLTAEMIGLNKVTLISKLKKYDINRLNFKNRAI